MTHHVLNCECSYPNCTRSISFMALEAGIFIDGAFFSYDSIVNAIREAEKKVTAERTRRERIEEAIKESASSFEYYCKREAGLARCRTFCGADKCRKGGAK